MAILLPGSQAPHPAGWSDLKFAGNCTVSHSPTQHRYAPVSPALWPMVPCPIAGTYTCMGKAWTLTAWEEFNEKREDRPCSWGTPRAQPNSSLTFSCYMVMSVGLGKRNTFTKIWHIPLAQQLSPNHQYITKICATPMGKHTWIQNLPRNRANLIQTSRM